MANATCQFTQDTNVGADGRSVLGFTSDTDVTLTDAGGFAANTTWLWEIISWPSPLSTPPTITNSTSQVATVTNPFFDGIYIVRLTRTENGVTTVDIKFFGVADEDGLYLPSAGQTGAMSNMDPTPTLSQLAGWVGRLDASSNVLLDAYLRYLKRVTKPLKMRGVVGAYGGSTTTPWYIDPVNGSDANDGLSSGTALQSIEEFTKRLGLQVIDGLTVDVILLNDAVYGSYSYGPVIKARFANDGKLTFTGQATVIATDTIASVTPWSNGVVGDYTLTHTNVTSLAGYFARITQGPNTGATSPIMKVTGTNSFRGSWSNINTGGTTIEPSVGDAVEIYRVTKITGGVTIDIEGLGQGVLFSMLDMGVPSSPPVDSVVIAKGGATFINCALHGVHVNRSGRLNAGEVFVDGFLVEGEAEIFNSSFTVSGGASALIVQGGGSVLITGDILVQGSSISVGDALRGSGEVISTRAFGGADIAVTDYTSDAVVVYPGSRLLLDDNMFLKDAAAGSLVGFKVLSGGQIAYNSGFTPFVSGTAPATFAKVGGTSKTLGQIPYFEVTNGAAFVVYQ